jgi:G3E family GTPase
MPTQAELELAARRVNLCLGAERQLLARNAQKRRLPVTIVTGFLGAGKTSLLQHILQHKLNLRVACAVSDLAAINVDALLVANQLAGNGNKLFQLQADPNASLAAFKDAVWQVLNEDDDAAGLGHVDYLVMETSGTTDPTQLVAAVQEKFGQMTRARLDSVVAVVDGDAVAQDAAKGLEPCVVAIRQLRCADVVLLNKTDLLDEENLRAAKQVISKYAPSARMYETDHGKVFLPHVLDIAPPQDAFNGGVSHEKVQAQWNTGLSALNGAVTPAPSRHRVDRGPEETYGDAPPAQAFASVAYERAAPIPLAAVHDWIQHHLPRGTLRAKGVMCIAELPTYRFVVQLSGKRRLEVENAGVWQSTPKTQFVVIGFNGQDASGGGRFDEAQARESLEACLSRSVGKLESEQEATRTACLAKLNADERFDALVSPEQATTVAFRLTCPTSTLDETMLRHHHHVDMNELTKRLVREVNAAGRGSLLLYATSLSPEDVEGEQVYAVASVIGPATVLSSWSELDSRAQLILDEVKKKLAGCLCGF